MSLKMNNSLLDELNYNLNFELDKLHYVPYEDVIILTYDLEKLNLDEVKCIFDYLKNFFPNNKVIGIPKNTALRAQDKESLLQWLKE